MLLVRRASFPLADGALVVVGDGDQGATVADVLEQFLHRFCDGDGVDRLQLPRLRLQSI